MFAHNYCRNTLKPVISWTSAMFYLYLTSPASHGYPPQIMPFDEITISSDKEVTSSRLIPDDTTTQWRAAFIVIREEVLPISQVGYLL